MTDEVNGGIIVDDMPQLGDEIRGRRRHRWGPVPSASLKPTQANGDAATDSAPQVAPKKRRRSRWDTGPEQGSGDGGETKGNSQALMLIPDEIVLSNGIKIIMPPAITGRHVSGDPEVVAMHKELADIERMLRGGTLQLPPEHERSPSPPPVYDSNGIRLNTREIRFKEKITRRRNALIEQLLKRDPAFKPPADYKPEKKWRKLYIPYKEYPEYNFIGLIIGPRGNTHKRMQQESNTVIAIRGKGSSKEGAAKSGGGGGGGAGYNDGDDDDLHVLITGDRDEDVDAAAAMVERLLQPLDEEMNEHKQKQLRELALINGTLKEENYCYLCGETGHRQVDCPKKSIDVYRLPDAVQAKVEEQYARDIARLNPGEGGNADEEYRSFLAELGGSDPRAAQPRGGPRESRESPDVKLWVGNLPPTLTSPDLRALFEPYGMVTYAEVKMDGPVSRGYGFVHYADSQMAKTAFEAMAGRMVDGRALNVRRKLEDSQGRRGLGANHVPLNSRPDDNIPPECKIYVGHIPMQVDEFILKREFEKFGTVVSAKLIIDRETGRPKGYGFVSMADGPSAAAAIASLNGYQGFDFQSRPIVVRQAGPPSNDHRGGRPPSGPPLPPGAPPAHHGGLPPPPPPYPGAYPPHPGAQHYQHMDPYAAAYQYGADPYGYAVHGGMPGAPGMPGMAGMGTDPYAAQYYDPNAYEAYGAAPAVDSTAEGQQYQHLPPPPPPPPPEGMLEEAIPPPPPPPLPEGDALPDQAPPPPPPPSLPTTESQNQQMSEYERFMAEMQAQIP